MQKEEDKKKKRIYEDNARVFRAFSDESRLMILELLKSGECCGRDLLADLPINQSTLSHHMKVLCESGVVESYKNGKMTHYSVAPGGVQNAIRLIGEITAPDTIVLTVAGEPAASDPSSGRWTL